MSSDPFGTGLSRTNPSPSSSDGDDLPDGGYGKPPAATRFRKGVSGNPRGRPRGSHRNAPYEAVLGRPVTIVENGEQRRVTAAEAFLLHLAKRGLEGDGAAARVAVDAIEASRAARPYESELVIRVTSRFTSAGSVVPAVEPLRMAVIHDRERATARLRLEPWLVEAALARLGGKWLTPAEQRNARAMRRARRIRSGGLRGGTSELANAQSSSSFSLIT